MVGQNSDVIMGRYSVANLQKNDTLQSQSRSCQRSCVINLVSLCLIVHKISLIISLWGFFPDAQGQLTLQSTVRSSQILNLSSLPAKIKKIRSKIEALECSQRYTSIV